MNELPEWELPTLEGVTFLQAEYGITLEPNDDQSRIDVEAVNAFTRWLKDVLSTYDGPFHIETDF